MPNPVLNELFRGLALMQQMQDRERGMRFEDEDRSRRNWSDQRADVETQMALARGGRPVETNEFGVEQVKDASLLADPRLFNVAGAQHGMRRAPDESRRIDYTTRGGRSVNVEAFNQGDLQEAAMLMDAAKTANALRLRAATESMMGQRQMAVEDFRNQGRVERDEATRKANMVEVEPGVLRTPQQVQALAAHKRANQPAAETVPVTLSGGQTVNVRPDTAARLDQQAKDRKARTARGGTGAPGGGAKPKAESATAKVTRLADRIIQETIQGKGTDYAHALDNLERFYQNDPEIKQNRDAVMRVITGRQRAAERRWAQENPGSLGMPKAPLPGADTQQQQASAQNQQQQAAPAARPTATNPQTGEKLEWDGKAWVPAQ